MYFSDLPSGQEDDRWHQLIVGKAPKGSIRFCALFKDYVILPEEEYEGLKNVSLWSEGCVYVRGDKSCDIATRSHDNYVMIMCLRNVYFYSLF